MTNALIEPPRNKECEEKYGSWMIVNQRARKPTLTKQHVGTAKLNETKKGKQ